MSKTLWDQYSQAYARVMRHASFHRQLVARTADRLSRRNEVLDAGCGPGLLLAALLAREQRACGLDQNESMLKEAQRGLKALGGDLQLCRGELDRLPFAPGTFDGAAAVNSLCYLDDPGQALEELHRVLEPGGILVVSGPGHHLAPEQLTARVEQDLARDGLDGSLKQDVGVVEACSRLLMKQAVRWQLDSLEMSRALSQAGFKRIMERDDTEYLGQNHFVVAVK